MRLQPGQLLPRHLTARPGRGRFLLGAARTALRSFLSGCAVPQRAVVHDFPVGPPGAATVHGLCACCCWTPPFFSSRTVCWATFTVMILVWMTGSELKCISGT